MAKSVIHTLRYAKQGVTDIEGAISATFTASTTFTTDQGDAGEPGPTEFQINDNKLDIEITSEDFFVLYALVGSAAANVVLGYKGSSAANKKITVKNVKFLSVNQASIPAKDGGGNVPGFVLSGSAQWGSSDTPALMLVDAADT